MVLNNKMAYGEFRFMEFTDDKILTYELISGIIIKKFLPNSIHQIVQANLMRHLGNYAFDKRLGRVLGAPLDVVFSDEDSVQPDVFFIKQAREKIIEWSGPVWGSPDLIVEIISKGTEKAIELINLSYISTLGSLNIGLLTHLFKRLKCLK